MESLTTQLPVLALDYGTKWTGVAMARTSLAEPLEVLASDEQLLAQVVKLITDKKIKTVLVGISEAASALRSQAFAEELGVLTDVPILYVDETLSSRSARDKLHATGKRVPPKSRIDHFAAAEFLQEWLDSGDAGI